ncbi:Fe-S cluster assembly protein SufB [uncultured Helcococcus sp.]|uniref:Fe-S cluster assembly protein SufB n=1 Tax=uncultured Helcococcus sp. TaxID=1072508 RepID=UPI002889A7A3|nr:Fe-S cluster assembly protein SufB [uncultured Helcococcus sp.]
MSKKTYVEDIDRGIYDRKNDFEYDKISSKGLTEEVVRQISAEKNEPEWMLKKRLEAMRIFYELDNPSWGPDLSAVDVDELTLYVKPKAREVNQWDNLPDNIKQTFYDLGIPQAEIDALAGVAAQYDSEVVYSNVKKYLKELGVVYITMEEAYESHEDLLKEWFGKAINPSMHKYAALHYAVWSGGSFVYVPKGVHVDIPIQSYFRFNAPGAGQFEHTFIYVDEGAYVHYIEGCSAPKYNVVNVHAGAVELFVKEKAKLRYSTIENWSKNMYNLNTKSAIVWEEGHIEWVSGSFGSAVSMLYPSSILIGENAKSDYTGITFANDGQILDTGTKVVHAAPNTYSTVNSRSISKSGGEAIYRGLVYFKENAAGSKSNVNCESLMLDNQGSVSDTIPVMIIENEDVDLGHEAKIGRIDDSKIFYLMSRGLSEEDAKAMLVRGFAEPIAKELPLEYAVEMNNLISLELIGSIG